MQSASYLSLPNPTPQKNQSRKHQKGFNVKSQLLELLEENIDSTVENKGTQKDFPDMMLRIDETS